MEPVTPGGDPPFARIGIVGLGLIGGSIALGLRRAWPGVVLVGFDRPMIAKTALARGVISLAAPRLVDLQDADLVVIATPVPNILEVIAESRRTGVRALLTDVGSTKRQIMTAADGLAFVGGHPIAGAAYGGLDRATADLFEGRPWLLVPGMAADADVERVEQFVHALGAVARRTDADTHDRVMAYVSHLPQLVASALMSAAGAAVGADGLAASGRGFADMTRLASSPADIWGGILATNADYIAEAVQALMATLPATPDQMADAARCDTIFRQANEWFATLPRD
jgi:prephenate dehydrogenase